MLPIEVMNATSESFVHQRLRAITRRIFPPVAIAEDIAETIFGGGGGGRTRDKKARLFTEAQLAGTRVHLAHGHGQSTPGHGWLKRDLIVAAGGGVGAGVVVSTGAVGSSTCSPGFVRLGNTCVPSGNGDLSPGITTPAEGQFQVIPGAFGMPAVAPKIRMISKHVCPKRMVLGEDNLCYPKAVLRRDSKYRKHRPGTRPILTGGQRRAIREAKSAVHTAKDAIAGFGISIKKKC
jgi:hypothetical protein